MPAITRRRSTSPFTDLFDWFETGWPMVADWRRDGDHVLRIEDHVDENSYILRAEIPDIDPDKDVAITVSDGVLTITARREEKVEEKGRSEFHYGSFVRRVTLPVGAKEDALAATYKDGILEVTVPFEAKVEHEPRHIPVSRAPAE